jgi:hypothetical protein
MKNIKTFEGFVNESKTVYLDNMSDVNLKKYNSLISFVNRTVEKLLAREGELPTSYFKPGLEARLDALTNNIKTIKDIDDNISEIISVHADLKDGIKGMKASGRL